MSFQRLLLITFSIGCLFHSETAKAECFSEPRNERGFPVCYRGKLITEADFIRFEKKVLTAKKRALEDILRFEQNPIADLLDGENTKQILHTMYEGLKDATIAVMEPREIIGSGCEHGDNYLATPRKYKNKIYICPIVLSDDVSEDMLYEGLIHESYHLQENILSRRNDDVTSEGSATAYEYTIVRNSNDGDCIYWEGGYGSEKVHPEIVRFLRKNRIRIPPTCASH